jgi:hypothetical protein
VRFLIKLIGRALGQKIESGSTLGAFLGMIFGLAVGTGLARLLIVGNLIGPDFSLAIYLITCIPLALIRTDVLALRNEILRGRRPTS